MLKSSILTVATVLATVTGALAQDRVEGPSYTEDGSAVRPTDWETWVFVGSPLTPNALNGGKANFQQFHSVYIEPTAFAHFKSTGEFPNGTQMVKVRTHLYEGDDCGSVDEANGSCQAVSGRGYFNGEYSGFELTIKDTERFEDPGGWVYYNFGESPQEWAESAKPFPAAACNACHAAAADNDFVFTQFYPVLRDSEPTLDDSRAKAGEEAMMKDGDGDMQKASLKQADPVESPVPVDVDELFAYLQSEGYKEFEVHETETHASAGPHVSYGKPVQVYFSDAVAASMAAGDDAHPAGSAIVKELYNDDATALIGWAVTVKTDQESDGGNGWFWVEFLSTEDVTNVAAPAENGSGACIGCHGGGNDFVLSHLPE